MDELVINTIRFLSIDAVEEAKSGHPGTPLALAPLGYIIFDRFLKFNPKNPRWLNRDRFILSCGHASMLLYSLLYLYGYDLSIEDIKNFRKLGSKTPGHPEYDLDIGVETTTGPLGQGLANSVGMAIAYKYLSAYFNKENYKIFNHNIFVIVSDGDLMEGISYEACSLAGHFNLNNLIVFWDNNGITIDGRTDLTWSEDVKMRFRAFNWEVFSIEDINNIEEIESKINLALKVKDKPKFIEVKSIIGYGTRKANSEKAHGEPLGKEEIEYARKFFNWKYKPFEVPDEVLNWTRRKLEEGEKLEREWNLLLKEYFREYPEMEKKFNIFLEKRIEEEVFQKLRNVRFNDETATRNAFGKVLETIWEDLDFLIGGSADLSTSNKTFVPKLGDFLKDNPLGKNIHFGVREHAMGSIVNGIALYGLRAFCGTFLIFSDYMKPSIRLSAFMKLPVIYIFTHDSIGLGEDGPTHQPIEQLAGLRSIPNLIVLRPADANETVKAMEFAINYKKGPIALILTRQNVPIIEGLDVEKLVYGAYVILEDESPEVIIYASGSEVYPSMKACEILRGIGIRCRLVNVVSFELFKSQSEDYRNYILGKNLSNVLRVSVEALSGFGWEEFIGIDGLKISMNEFGKSGHYKDLFEHFGFTPKKIAFRILSKL
ncbi:MAG: transketolase [candidate division WOR-3 bacterium]|nr:transketolase [candidate division WOR-3 bacterium]